MAATPAKIVTPLIGAALGIQYSPKIGTVAASAEADAAAPFPIGTSAHAMKASDAPGLLDAQFVRASAVITAGATAGVTAGVFGGTAGAGNTWTNQSGASTVVGNYLWVTAVPVTSP